MSAIEFIWNGNKTIIQTTENEKISEVVKKFFTKAGQNLENISFLYGGKQLNLESTFSEAATSIDKEEKKMAVLVIGDEDEETEDVSNLQKSKIIICPECKENARIKIDNYKITLYDCKNKHKKDNILFNDFESTQFIDESKILCDKCKETNKGSTFQNKFFICNTCKINLCPICNNSHINEHETIDYEQKYFTCNTHNEKYNSYCSKCKADICVICEKDHIGHDLISYGSIIQDKKELKEKLNNFWNKINDFKNEIKETITILNNLMENFDVYYNIYDNMINNYEIKNRNFSCLQNIKDINDDNKIIIDRINKILNNKSIKNKFNDMIDIYNEMINSNNNNNKVDTDKNQEIKFPDNIISKQEDKIQDEIIIKKEEDTIKRKDISDNNNNNIKINNILNKKNEKEENKEEILIKDNYNSFQISKVKELKSYTIPKDDKYNKIDKIFTLKDNKVLMCIEGDTNAKFVIYSEKNNDIYNINLNKDIKKQKIHDILQIDDKKIILLLNKDILLIDVNKNEIIKQISYSNLGFNFVSMIVLSEKKIGVFYSKDINTVIIYEIYEYENGNLVFRKKKETKIIPNIWWYKICKINENEVGVSISKSYPFVTKYYLLLYDIKTDKVIKTLTVDKEIQGLKLINNNNLLLWDEKKLFLIDTNKNIIAKKIAPKESYIEKIIPLNDNKILLYFTEGETVYQYKIEDRKDIIFEQEKLMNIKYILELIKYVDNKIIAIGWKNRDKIIIFS